MTAYYKKFINEDNYIVPPEDFSDFSTGNIITVNKDMKNIISLAKRISRTEVPVLITGPSGVGKEVFGELIHSCSSRIENPFIKLNCAAIPQNLMESEFFGYESGSFTGASRSGKKGLIELAEKGTLFLDEIGEMPLDIQSKLLRVLQDGKFLKIGGKKEVKSDIRILVATNKNLERMIENNLFREDLYFRLNVISIYIPPLNERKDDIPILILYYISYFNKQYNTNKKLSLDVMEELVRYNWPGNVRELKNIVERLILISLTDNISTQDLLYSYSVSNSNDSKKQVFNPNLNKKHNLSLKEMVSEYELDIINEAIKRHGTLRKAAAALDVPPSTISRKLSQQRMNKKD